VEGVVQNILF